MDHFDGMRMFRFAYTADLDRKNLPTECSLIEMDEAPLSCPAEAEEHLFLDHFLQPQTNFARFVPSKLLVLEKTGANLEDLAILTIGEVISEDHGMNMLTSKPRVPLEWYCYHQVMMWLFQTHGFMTVFSSRDAPWCCWLNGLLALVTFLQQSQNNQFTGSVIFLANLPLSEFRPICVMSAVSFTLGWHL